MGGETVTHCLTAVTLADRPREELVFAVNTSESETVGGVGCGDRTEINF